MSIEPHVAAKQVNWNGNPVSGHFVQFYETSQFLLDTLTSFITSTLLDGEASIVVASESHLASLNERLDATGVDMPDARRNGQYLSMDAREAMTRFMDNGVPSPERFNDLFGTVIDAAKTRWGGVRVFGEMVALMAEMDARDATISIEQLWNDLLERHEFSLSCAYPIGTFSGSDSESFLREICDQHTAVFPAESYAQLPTEEARHQEVAILQQKARRLEVEAAQRKRVEEQLRDSLEAERAARQQAEAALRERDKFVSIAAHELKTPLTSLRGHLQMMLRNFLSNRPTSLERINVGLSSINQQADRLSRLVSHLLDISRLENGELPLEREPVDVSALVRESVSNLHFCGDQHTIVVDAPDSLIAELDPLRMEQVIANLLNNAIRYSPGGGSIAISLYSTSNDALELSIRDYGIGIPADKRERIFEPYYQAHHHESRSGMGLGLYISRHIVNLHGGDVHVEFPSDGGTRFVVSLPISSRSNQVHPAD